MNTRAPTVASSSVVVGSAKGTRPPGRHCLNLIPHFVLHIFHFSLFTDSLVLRSLQVQSFNEFSPESTLWSVAVLCVCVLYFIQFSASTTSRSVFMFMTFMSLFVVSASLKSSSETGVPKYSL